MNPVGAWKAKLERTYAFRFQSNIITVCLQTKFFDYFWKNLKNYIGIYVFNNYLNSHLKIKLDLPRWRLLTDSIKFFFPNSKVFNHFGQTVTQGPQGSILVRVQGVRTIGLKPYWSHIIILFSYRGFSPFTNFISANFISAIF